MDAKWLATQFKSHPEKSKADLARALGLEPPAISKILSGGRQIKAQEYLEMCRFFDMRPESGAFAQPHRSASTKGTLSPLISGLEENEGFSKTSDDQWVIPAYILEQRTKSPSEKIRIFKIEDSLMEPDFMRGEHVLVDTLDTRPSPPGIFVISDGFGPMARFCEFVPQSTPPHIRVCASSPKLEDRTFQYDNLEIIGRVIAKLQWL